MSFVAEFDSLPFESLLSRSERATAADVREVLQKPSRNLADFATLISPAAGQQLAEIARLSHASTVQRFGRVIRLFAPLQRGREA